MRPPARRGDLDLVGPRMSTPAAAATKPPRPIVGRRRRGRDPSAPGRSPAVGDPVDGVDVGRPGHPGRSRSLMAARPAAAVSATTTCVEDRRRSSPGWPIPTRTAIPLAWEGLSTSARIGCGSSGPTSTPRVSWTLDNRLVDVQDLDPMGAQRGEQLTAPRRSCSRRHRTVDSRSLLRTARWRSRSRHRWIFRCGWPRPRPAAAAPPVGSTHPLDRCTVVQLERRCSNGCAQLEEAAPRQVPAPGVPRDLL